MAPLGSVQPLQLVVLEVARPARRATPPLLPALAGSQGLLQLEVGFAVLSAPRVCASSWGIRLLGSASLVESPKLHEDPQAVGAPEGADNPWSPASQVSSMSTQPVP